LELQDKTELKFTKFAKLCTQFKNCDVQQRFTILCNYKKKVKCFTGP